MQPQQPQSARRAPRAASPTDAPTQAPFIAPDVAAAAAALQEAPLPTNGSSPPPSPPMSPGDLALADPTHDYTAGGEGTFTSRMGVVLKLRRYSLELILQIQRNMDKDRPKPPSKYVEADDKNIVDEFDPDYRRKLTEFVNRSADVGFLVRITQGTELLEVPEGVYGPDDEGWIEEIGIASQIFGQSYAPEIHRDDPKIRYAEWLKYYVLGEGDESALYRLLDRSSGMVRESEVEEAMRSFRSLGRRDPDS